MDWSDITGYFHDVDLLSNVDLEISAFDDLESELLDHIFNVEIATPKCVVMFDGESIEAPDAYAYLFEEFLSAFSNDIKVKLISSNIDFDNQVANISAKKRSKLFKKQWQQDNDWVSEDFLAYVIEVTNNRNEVFISLDSGDQTIVYICVDKKIGAFLKKAKSDSEKSGVKYFMSEFGGGGPVYDYTFLPRKQYLEIREEFSNLFLEGKVGDITSYKNDTIEIIFNENLNNRDDKEYMAMEFIQSARKALGAAPGSGYYVPKTIWDCRNLIPDSDAYVFTIDLKLGILFESNARKAFGLYEACSEWESTPNLIYMGKDRKWGMIAKPVSNFYLIVMGTAIESLKHNELVKSIE